MLQDIPNQTKHWFLIHPATHSSLYHATDNLSLNHFSIRETLLSIAIDYKPHSVTGKSFNYLAALADLSGFQNGEKACKVFKYLAALATCCKKLATLHR